MAPELLPELVEELGLLLDPKDLGAARATCSAWRNHLSQRVSATPSGGWFEVMACGDVHAWQKRVQSMASVFPALKHLLVYAGGRVGEQVLAAEVAALAAAMPQLQRLELRFLQPIPGSAGINPLVASSSPAQLPLPAIPSGLLDLQHLTHLALVMCADPTTEQLTRLPTSLQELRIASAYDTHGLSDPVLEQLASQLPCLRYLEADVASYSVTAVGLNGLPGSLQELILHGVVALGSDEVQALCQSVPRLTRLAVEIPSDRHEQVVSLVTHHTSLRDLELGLNQDEADHDPTIQELMDTLKTLAQPPETAPETAISPIQGSPGSPGRGGSPDRRVLQPRTGGWGVGRGAWRGQPPVRSAWATGGSPPRVTGSPSASHSPPSSILSPTVPLQDATTSTTSCRITSLLLQSVNLPAQTGGTSLLSHLAHLTSLTHLCIAEPWVEGGRGTAITGGLTDLTTLVNLRTCVVSLMPGFPIPAFHVTKQVLQCFSLHCPRLASLSALNAIDPDPQCLSSLSTLSGLESLMLSPAATTNHPSQLHNGPIEHVQGSNCPALPVLDLTCLPPVTQLTLSSFTLTLPATTTVASADQQSVTHLTSGYPGSVAAHNSGHPVTADVAAHDSGHAVTADMAAHDLQDKTGKGSTSNTATPPTPAMSSPPPASAPATAAAGVDLADLVTAAAASVTDPGARSDSHTPTATTTEAVNLGHLEDLVLSHVDLGHGLEPAWKLLAACSGLQSLMLRHVSGLEDDTFADTRVQLTKLTSLQVLPAPTPPPAPLTQAGVAHCSRLTALKRLEWEGWGAAQRDDEPDIVRQLAQGAKGLHVLRLSHALDPQVRAETARVVRELLPLCCLGAN